MVDVNKLKGKIYEAGMTIPGLARRIYRKLERNGEGLLVKDVDKIISIVDISDDDITPIFFTQLVA